MFKLGDIIQYKNNKFEIVEINKEAENPLFKYELKPLNGDRNHNYFMGDEDIKKYNIKKIN